jgi:ABC-type cobalamin/Fe3+-siderophores transport system ATPase subunit
MVAYGSPAEIFTPTHLSQAYGSRFRDRQDWLALDDTCCEEEHDHA